MRGEGEKKLFACMCDHREKVSDFEKRRAEAGANKAEVRKYLEAQEKENNKAGQGNTALAEQLAKWMKESGWNNDENK
jgi:DNA topoisomerase-3